MHYKAGSQGVAVADTAAGSSQPGRCAAASRRPRRRPSSAACSCPRCAPNGEHSAGRRSPPPPPLAPSSRRSERDSATEDEEEADDAPHPDREGRHRDAQHLTELLVRGRLSRACAARPGDRSPTPSTRREWRPYLHSFLHTGPPCNLGLDDDVLRKVITSVYDALGDGGRSLSCACAVQRIFARSWPRH